jgi:hypothetical protein
MKIHISHSTKVMIEHRPYKIVERGKIDVKGKGEMKTYFVLCKVDEDGKSIKCPFMEIFEQFKLKEQQAGGGAKIPKNKTAPSAMVTFQENKNSVEIFDDHKSDSLDFFNDPKQNPKGFS